MSRNASHPSAALVHSVSYKLRIRESVFDAVRCRPPPSASQAPDSGVVDHGRVRHRPPITVHAHAQTHTHEPTQYVESRCRYTKVDAGPRGKRLQ